MEYKSQYNDISMKELKDVLDNYQDLLASTKLSKKPTRIEQIAIKHTIPKILNATIQKENRKNPFRVKGSYGEGKLARIPWVAIFNQSITESARKGYYIVLLFSQDMQSCYLSLNQGVTNYVETYGQANALQRMQKVAKQALNYFTPHAETIKGNINLKAEGDLGQCYEKGNIEAFYYEKSNLPTQKQFEQHVEILLGHYEQLFNHVGKNIQDIIANNEDNYQLLTQQKAAKLMPQNNSMVKEPKESTYMVNSPVRDPNIAAQALCNADFKCQIDPNHQTFLSNATKKPYVEAHHFIPLSQRNKFKFSLDVLSNIIVLCPKCHRLLHYGTWKDKKTHLENFLHQRETLLAKDLIPVTLKQLKEFYKHDLTE